MYRLLVLLALGSTYGALLDGDIDIADGVKLVSIPVSNSLEDEGRGFGDSPLFRIAKFLSGHELRVKLPNLVEKEKISKIVEESLRTVDETYNSAGTGRRKGGGGGGSIALLGMMMAKTLGAVGLGGVALLTMKALAASALALMLSAIIGVKKLTSHDDHEDHQVIYAGHHGHHRRKRETPLPYRGWLKH
ncbi:uncharacterized protein LOC125238246 [Leguminivora glycinivorella]|uniref:uncharacterized protein LOC125238246 n=1 Tax=Leguminivora glycinivorella TaxID=1035111 RepID=UPI00200F0C76|nr:uncharacterized protein LOC125238246 [Leguminivora glycinivorella]